MITHRLKPEVLQYTCLYVEPEIRGPGVGLSLLARAILRQAEETDIPRFIWMVDAEHARMHRFLSSRFASIIDTEDALLESAKQL
jgi:GNAT superfamily N-acetyltransferase